MNQGRNDHTSFVMWHRYGEIWIENLNGLMDKEDEVIEIFYRHMKEIKKEESPTGIAVNLEETIISDYVANYLIRYFHEAGNSVRKVAFVGVKKEYESIIVRYLKRYQVFFACRFFKGFPAAKNWLM